MTLLGLNTELRGNPLQCSEVVFLSRAVLAASAVSVGLLW